jgi:hypothetical protein
MLPEGQPDQKDMKRMPSTTEGALRFLLSKSSGLTMTYVAQLAIIHGPLSDGRPEMKPKQALSLPLFGIPLILDAW